MAILFFGEVRMSGKSRRSTKMKVYETQKIYISISAVVPDTQVWHNLSVVHYVRACVCVCCILLLCMCVCP